MTTRSANTMSESFLSFLFRMAVLRRPDVLSRMRDRLCSLEPTEQWQETIGQWTSKDGWNNSERRICFNLENDNRSIGKLGYFSVHKSTNHRKTTNFHYLGSAENSTVQNLSGHYGVLCWSGTLAGYTHSHLLCFYLCFLCYCSYLRRMKAAEDKKKAAADE